MSKSKIGTVLEKITAQDIARAKEFSKGLEFSKIKDTLIAILKAETDGRLKLPSDVKRKIKDANLQVNNLIARAKKK